MTNESEEKILSDVLAEIDRQDKKWGEGRTNETDLWCTVLMEEVGEVARAALEQDKENMREELLQVAALAIQIVDDLDRGNFKR
jgi:NTP pyrophosphatase (non-canonical NTP hydrolase)